MADSVDMQLREAIQHRDFWRAACDEMVARNRILRTRPDLSAEQVAERLGLLRRLKSAEHRLSFLKDKGLIVGLMKESGKDPYLVYVIEPGSEMSDDREQDEILKLQIENERLKKQLEERDASTKT